MQFTVREMQLLCVFHKGTVSETLKTLHGAGDVSGEKQELFRTVADKLSRMEKGEPAALTFDPEE